jgi:hypothetical protein
MNINTEDKSNKEDKKNIENTPKLKVSDYIIPLIGVSFGLLTYSAWMFTIFFLITGSSFVRTVLVLLLIFQFCFAKRSEVWRRFLMKLRAWDYFKSFDVHVEEELKNHHSLFAFHPHGIMGFGCAMAPSRNEVLYDSIFCGSRALINLPISGIFARLMGVCGVDNKSFKELMKKGKNIIFVPGGFECATLTNYDKDRTFIKIRKGFIKYALEFGYSIYPCYTFNENKVYFTINIFEKFRLLLNKIKLPGTIFYSKYLFFPNSDIDLFTVIGKPVHLPLIVNPTPEEVDNYHKIYIDALLEVYNRYKTKYGASEELEII